MLLVGQESRSACTRVSEISNSDPTKDEDKSQLVQLLDSIDYVVGAVE